MNQGNVPLERGFQRAGASEPPSLTSLGRQSFKRLTNAVFTQPFLDASQRALCGPSKRVVTQRLRAINYNISGIKRLFRRAPSHLDFNQRAEARFHPDSFLKPGIKKPKIRVIRFDDQPVFHVRLFQVQGTGTWPRNTAPSARSTLSSF